MRGSGRFEGDAAALVERLRVSIPFIAGQWSLLDAVGRWLDLVDHVSIPFIAGQWSLRASTLRGASTSPRLNPLHCGAVVASSSATICRRRFNRSQSPSLRGSGRFKKKASRVPPHGGRLNPLHCGAVVASHAHAPDAHACACLNPLHCGAVVASRGGARRDPEEAGESLNPLHCGAVVASPPAAWRRGKEGSSLNPLHCGAVVASERAHVTGRPVGLVSITIISGQWSLRG